MSRKRELIQEELIQAAIQCFDTHGYQHTSLEDIVQRVGISRMTFYTYFESKAALLKALCERSLSDYRQQLEELLAQPLSRPEKLRRAVALQITALTSDQPLTRLFFREEVNLPQEVAQTVNQMHREIDRLLEQEIEDGIERGEIVDEDPRLLLYAFTGMCNWLYRWYRPVGMIQPEDIIQVFTRILESGCLTPQARNEEAVSPRNLQRLEKSLENSLQEIRRELAFFSHQSPPDVARHKPSSKG